MIMTIDDRAKLLLRIDQLQRTLQRGRTWRGNRTVLPARPPPVSTC
jgi:hypothetical protein